MQIKSLSSRFYNYTNLNRKKILILFLLGSFISFHLFLLSQTFFIDSSGNIRTTIAGYGDIPLHLTQITKFAFEKSINLEEPIYYGQLLHYPFLINLISGFLLRATGNFSFSVLYPVFILASFNILLVFFIYRKILKSNSWAYLTMLLFFLGSGFGSFNEYVKRIFDSGFNIVGFINYLIQNNVSTVVRLGSVYPLQNIDYGAPLSLAFLHQRAFILGFFVFLIFLTFIIYINHYRNRKLIIISGVCLGILPLMHTHSFVVAIITVLSFLTIALLKKDFYYAKTLIIVGIIGGLLSFPQLFYLLGTKTIGQTSSFIAFRLGWMVQPTVGSIIFSPGEQPTIFSQSFIQFLWINFGIILPAFVLSFFVLIKRKNFTKPNIIIVWPIALCGFLLFIISQLIRFQPWDFDNYKIFVYFQFFAIPVIVLIIRKIHKTKRIVGTFILTIFVISSLFSGILDLIPRVATPYNSLPIIFDNNAIAMAGYIRKNIPEQDMILTGTSFKNLVSSLAGRPVLLGYTAWLWSRGINYYERERQIQNFYLSPSKNSTLLKKYHIEYVLLSNYEIYDLKANKSLFNQKFAPVHTVGEFTLYKI